MRDLMRSEWLKGLLVLVMALMVAQCGTDDGGCTNCGNSGPSEPQCVNEDLTAGLYSFEIVPGGVEGCNNLFVLLEGFKLIPPGPYSIVFPSYGQLSDDPITVTLPLPGSPQVTGRLSEVSGDIVLTVDGTTHVPVDLPEYVGLPDIIIPINIAGTLCPISEDTVDVELAITLPHAVEPFTSGGCTIEAKLRGTRQ